VCTGLGIASCGGGGDKTATGDTTTSGSTASTTTMPTPVDPLEGASTDAQGGPPGGATGTVGNLVDVRTGRGNGFDRVVFEFSGDAVPTWTGLYDKGPFTEDPSDRPVEVGGDAFYVVTMHSSGSDPETGEATYTGPKVVPGKGTSQVVEVVESGDFERVLQWIVGLHDEVPVRVTSLKAPTRLVLDFAPSA
jgi:hypothetical protein